MLIEIMHSIAKKTGFDTYIATDSKKILNIAKKFTDKVLLTPENIKSGTLRVAHIAKKLNYRVYVNLQCDEPLIKPSTIKKVAMLALKSGCISTAYCISDKYEEFINPNRVKVIVDETGDAVYFSRSPVPYQKKFSSFKKHIGIYAFPANLIKKIEKIKEKDIEDLEQNMWLLKGYKIKMVRSPYTHSIDVHEDIKVVEKLL